MTVRGAVSLGTVRPANIAHVALCLPQTLQRDRLIEKTQVAPILNRINASLFALGAPRHPVAPLSPPLPLLLSCSHDLHGSVGVECAGLLARKNAFTSLFVLARHSLTRDSPPPLRNASITVGALILTFAGGEALTILQGDAGPVTLKTLSGDEVRSPRRADCWPCVGTCARIHTSTIIVALVACTATATRCAPHPDASARLRVRVYARRRVALTTA